MVVVYLFKILLKRIKRPKESVIVTLIFISNKLYKRGRDKFRRRTNHSALTYISFAIYILEQVLK